MIDTGSGFLRVQVKGTEKTSGKRSGGHVTPTYKFNTLGLKPQCDVVALVALDVEKIYYRDTEFCLHKSSIWVTPKNMCAASDVALEDAILKCIRVE